MHEPTEGEPHEQAVEIRFQLSEESVPVLSAAERAGAQVHVEGVQPRTGDEYATLCRIDGSDPGEAVRRATDVGDEALVLSRAGHGGLVEVRQSGGSPSLLLAERGALPRRLRRIDDDPVLDAQVPPPYDAGEIIDRFLDAHHGADLTAVESRSTVAPTAGSPAFKAALEERLTPRQWEALRTAYEGGYYRWPRAVTAEELAGRMDITPPTFGEHLRAAERELVQLVF